MNKISKKIFIIEFVILFSIGIIGFFEPSVWLFGTIYVALPISIAVPTLLFFNILYSFLNRRDAHKKDFMVLILSIVLAIIILYIENKMSENFAKNFDFF